MEASRYIVGIDLGTTNIAVYYVDTEQDDARIRQFPVPQVTAAGEVDDRPLMPSFCYLPGASDLPQGTIALPWADDLELTVGCFARDQGAAVPDRLIVSAKSWLAHAGVDRTQPILPWGSELAGQQRSPVAVTALYLDHIRQAWNYRFRSQLDAEGSPCTLEAQQIIITIPASFDETARDLTIAAARQAGFRQMSLLEEPLAAFYAWLSHHESDWQETIAPGDNILIVDVGGGTTDFSIVTMDAQGNLQRMAVGEHLLLGGDNIDIAIAHELERDWQTKLSGSEWSQLCQLCRRAKEELLSSNRDEVSVTLLSKGSSVLAGARSAKFQRRRLLQLLESGFYPQVDVSSPPVARRAGMRTMGLPYASEPAVTRHLLDFLRYASRIGGGSQDQPVYPTRVLFNGGSMIAPVVRERLLSIIASWFTGQPASAELVGEDYSLAVAIGAAYYGRVRRGLGVKVRGGIARSYYLEVGHGDGARLICAMARDTDEAVAVELPGKYRLRTNDKVLFNLYSSATRLADRPGDVVDSREEVSLVAPLVSVLKYGKGETSEIEITASSVLTEVGALEISLAAAATSHRWPLRFDLRLLAELESTARAGTVSLIVDADRVAAATGRLRNAFEAGGDSLKSLVGDLELELDTPRDAWSLPLLRQLADALLALEPSRGRTPQHEMRWLNLAGYCLRPGFGDAADELRLRQVWKWWFDGPRNSRQPQVVAEWWVFWRRLASGLRAGHQQTIADQLVKQLFPKNQYQAKVREGEQAMREMWRCLGALELAAAKTKRAIGRVLLDRGSKLAPYELWVLARAGARRLFHATVDATLPMAIAESWINQLTSLTVSPQAERMRLFALSRLAARTGDRHLDVSDDAWRSASAALSAGDCPAAWHEVLAGAEDESREDRARLLGDALPLGLSWVSDE